MFHHRPLEEDVAQNHLPLVIMINKFRNGYLNSKNLWKFSLSKQWITQRIFSSFIVGAT